MRMVRFLVIKILGVMILTMMGQSTVQAFPTWIPIITSLVVEGLMSGERGRRQLSPIVTAQLQKLIPTLMRTETFPEQKLEIMMQITTSWVLKRQLLKK